MFLSAFVGYGGGAPSVPAGTAALCRRVSIKLIASARRRSFGFSIFSLTNCSSL
jgi:hypothetical protein